MAYFGTSSITRICMSVLVMETEGVSKTLELYSNLTLSITQERTYMVFKYWKVKSLNCFV